MLKFKVTLCCVVMVLAGPHVVSALPTVDELMKQTQEAGEKIKTFSSDMDVKMTMGPMSMTGTGRAVGKKTQANGKTIHKYYSVMTMETPGRNGQKMTQTQKRVCDGKYLWEEMTSPMAPATMVTKKLADADAGAQSPGGSNPALMFEEMKKTYDLKVTGEEKVDGVACYVITGTLRKDAGGGDDNPGAAMMKAMMSTMKMYIAKKDMFPRKMVVGTADRPFMTMALKNVKINGTVDETLFKYTPPAGAQINDRTGE